MPSQCFSIKFISFPLPFTYFTMLCFPRPLPVHTTTTKKTPSTFFIKLATRFALTFTKCNLLLSSSWISCYCLLYNCLTKTPRLRYNRRILFLFPTFRFVDKYSKFATPNLFAAQMFTLFALGDLLFSKFGLFRFIAKHKLSSTQIHSIFWNCNCNSPALYHTHRWRAASSSKGRCSTTYSRALV